MKYLKLWKYAFCPFYVNFVPLIILSLILSACCNSNDAEEKAYQKLKAEQERTQDCDALASCLGAQGTLGFLTEEGEWVCSIFKVKNNNHLFQSIRASHLGAATWGCQMHEKFGDKK